MKNFRGIFRSLPPHFAMAALTVLLASCGGELATTESEAAKSAQLAAASAVSSQASTAVTPKAGALANPILFVTQVPTQGDLFASRMSTFANHLPGMDSVPRGGDLMIRYADGAVRNLTKEAGFGMEGLQGTKAIAVREPSVHWGGTKAIFSMLVGGPSAQYAYPNAKWQLYEVTGLGKTQAVSITKVAKQPDYNNVSPLYASDDRILFTSDRPRGGESHLYPQLDEYESTATITGIYSLDPVSGVLRILNHTPSGAFSPTIDSYGRLIFTRWDHLQRDQQADAGSYGAYNYASEASSAAKLALQAETFPESRTGMSSAYGNVNGMTFNLFSPWQMNQDGTHEQTLNHIGRQELSFGYLVKSFSTDGALQDSTGSAPIANKKYIRGDGGLFHLREDPRTPGTYYAIYAREFAQATTNQIVRITGAPSLNAEQMTIVDASPAESGSGLAGGRFRNPLPLLSGQMVAAYTASAQAGAGMALRLTQLEKNASGLFVAGAALTPGISKNLSWWSPDVKRTYNGLLWELEPVEVVARARPASPVSTLETPEKAVLNEELIDEGRLRDWMVANKLALIVTRNQTSRDRGDRQQPFNLRVPSGATTTSGSGKVYDISHYQILQGDQIRAYNGEAGRRVIAQPTVSSKNPPNTSGPTGSVKIATDGSTAAFVPASRALTWQTTDANGVPVVRERVWVTMQPGEIRTCSGCHGENSKNQAGAGEPLNKPEALRALLRYWKANNQPNRLNGSQAQVPGAAAAVTQASSQAVPSTTTGTAPTRFVRVVTPTGRLSSANADSRR